MPEGPEIRREADRIARVLAGRSLHSVYFGLPRLERFAKGLVGARVQGIETRGKALIIHFSTGESMYSHNQLYGKWVVQKRGAQLNTNRSLRVALHVQGHSALLYSASNIEIMKTRALDQHTFLRNLGPDVLDNGLVWRRVAARLKQPAFEGRSLGALYLDQRFLAGIGNYLRSEILHHCGLSPRARPRDLGRAQLGRLARSTLTIAKRAYVTGGLTNHPPLLRRLQKAGVRREEYRFAVFARDGLPCYRCGTTIERVEAGGRRLYLCPTCQPAPKR